MGTLADDLRREAELLRRRFVHHTRSKHPLSMEEATALTRRMLDFPTPDEFHDMSPADAMDAIEAAHRSAK